MEGAETEISSLQLDFVLHGVLVANKSFVHGSSSIIFRHGKSFEVIDLSLSVRVVSFVASEHVMSLANSVIKPKSPVSFAMPLVSIVLSLVLVVTSLVSVVM